MKYLLLLASLQLGITSYANESIVGAKAVLCTGGAHTKLLRGITAKVTETSGKLFGGRGEGFVSIKRSDGGVITSLYPFPVASNYSKSFAINIRGEKGNFELRGQSSGNSELVLKLGYLEYVVECSPVEP